MEVLPKILCALSVLVLNTAKIGQTDRNKCLFQLSERLKLVYLSV